MQKDSNHKHFMCGIYKIENLINGKIYVGKSVNIEKRFKTHINDSFNKNKPEYHHLIHKAIRKYKVENFSFDIVEECDENELNSREMYWIHVYDCCVLDGKDKGYNMTRGGEGSSSIDVYKVYKLWDEGLSIAEIADILHNDRHAISIRVKEYENYTQDEHKSRYYNLVAKSRQKEICQYDLIGNFINQYDSVLDASEKTGVGYRTICSNIQGQTNSAGGFQWRYKDDQPPGKYCVKGNGYKTPIVQLDLEYKLINVFDSLKSAAEAVGLKTSSTLSYAIKHHNSIIKGSHWMTKKDYDLLHEADLNAH